MAIQTRDIDYTHDAAKLQGYLAYDDAQNGKRPAVIVCHEWWGLNDQIRGRARQIAELGYVAFALDMFGKGVVTANHEEAARLMNALLTNPAAKARTRAAFDVVQKLDQVDANRIAAIGYCMGGSLALGMARAGLPIRGAVCFHGTLKPDKPAAPGSVKARLLVGIGADDPMVGMDQIEAFSREMRDAGADYQIIIYGHARHAFTNPNADSKGLDGLKYNPNADRRSWQAMKSFFAEVLG